MRSIEQMLEDGRDQIKKSGDPKQGVTPEEFRRLRNRKGSKTRTYSMNGDRSRVEVELEGVCFTADLTMRLRVRHTSRQRVHV